jgi:hypothetical protein
VRILRVEHVRGEAFEGCGYLLIVSILPFSPSHNFLDSWKPKPGHLLHSSYCKNLSLSLSLQVREPPKLARQPQLLEQTF